MRTPPLLPCASIDEIAKFADHLGFRVTYRQVRPNPYVALDRDGLVLHYFGIPGFLAEDSDGSCVVVPTTSRHCSTPSPPGCEPRMGSFR